jgi:hypothetical protein
MTSALAYKEFRETAGIAALGLAALLLAAVSNMGWELIPGWHAYGQIPFLNDRFSVQFYLLAGLLAVALGFRQSLGDFHGDAYLFLLHRPRPRRHVFASKLLVGLASYALCAALPVLLYAWWAGLPGTHASPFEWWMTRDVWLAWLTISVLYLGAFLSGIRPGKWFGTRLLPLAATLLAPLLIALLPLSAAIPVLILLSAVLISVILFVSETRDFA